MNFRGLELFFALFASSIIYYELSSTRTVKFTAVRNGTSHEFRSSAEFFYGFYVVSRYDSNLTLLSKNLTQAEAIFEERYLIDSDHFLVHSNDLILTGLLRINSPDEFRSLIQNLVPKSNPCDYILLNLEKQVILHRGEDPEFIKGLTGAQCLEEYVPLLPEC